MIASSLIIICVAKWVKLFNFFPAGPGRREAVCSSPLISYALFSLNVDLRKQAPVFWHCIFLANFKGHLSDRKNIKNALISSDEESGSGHFFHPDTMHFNWRKTELKYKSISYGAGWLLQNCPEISRERGLSQTQVTFRILPLAVPGDLKFWYVSHFSDSLSMLIESRTKQIKQSGYKMKWILAGDT